jgi:L-amino acid N-acyltransferase YncA
MIDIRPYQESDRDAVVDVYRDGYDALRIGHGGNHQDYLVDRVQNLSDEALARRILDGYFVVVAEESATGELLGIGAVSDRPLDRFLGSARSKTHYVRRNLQGGRGGVGIGSQLRQASLERARSLGHRKVWGYALSESRRWHAKFGATFHPFHNTYNPEHSSIVYYYEIILQPSGWNRLRVEPWLFRLSKLWPTLKARWRDRGK